MTRLTTSQIAEHVDGELVGPGDRPISGVDQLGRAGPETISFVRDASFADSWRSSQAGAALVAREIELDPGDGRALIRVDDADLAMALVLELFAPPPVQPDPGVDERASVHPQATLGQGVRVGPGAVIARGATLGDHAVIHANATVLDDARIGAGCVLWPGAVVGARCTLGQRCILHPNAVIGADGFGYRPRRDGSGLKKIPQIGTVELGDDVEIGAGTTIDRAKFSVTRIGSGTKIDNLCQIAHNCEIGRHVVIASGTMIAGSVVVGDGVMFGGCASIRDNVKIGAGAKIMGFAGIMRDVPAGETWGGYIAQEAGAAAREAAAMRKLPHVIRRIPKK